MVAKHTQDIEERLSSLSAGVAVVVVIQGALVVRPEKPRTEVKT